MLSVTRLSDPTGAYYLGDLEIDSVEFALFGESLGAWVGAGSDNLGLSGKVSSSSFATLLSGRHPRTDRVLADTGRRVCGYDLTFSAPKSVSVLFGLAPRSVSHAVLDAHRSAVDVAVDYLDRRALAVRRGSGDDRTLLATDGVIGASFTHGTSRALDPHLHSHVVVANLAHGDDSRWSALDSRGLYAHSAAAESLYFAHLRDRLSRDISVTWVRDRNDRIDIAGIDPLLLGAFSNRQAEIRQHLADRRHGRLPNEERDGRDSSLRGLIDLRTKNDLAGCPIAPSRRARQVAALTTRDPKEKGLTRGEIDAIWSNRASSVGFDGAELQASLAATLDYAPQSLDRAATGSVRVDEHRYASILVVSPHATAKRRDVVKAWSDSIIDGEPAGEVERCVDLIVGDGVVEVGVAERSHPLSSLVPSNDAIRALGPRPIGSDDYRRWKSAEVSIDDYKRRWGVNYQTIGLDAGEARPEMNRFSIKQLADHALLMRIVDAKRRALGREISRDQATPDLLAGRTWSR